VELSLTLPERRRGRGRSRKYSKKGFKDDVTPTTYLSRKSFEGLTNSTQVKKPLKKRALPFDEEEDDASGPLYVSIDDRRGVGNKSEFSGSRSRSGRRRYRSKSEDIYERRKLDEQSEELSKIARGVNQKGKKKKRVRIRMGSLAKLDPHNKGGTGEKVPAKPQLKIETLGLDMEY
jgi:hypothetical protein